MYHLQPIPAAEMVATFLHPDLSTPADTAYRAQLLGELRGYGRDQDVFQDVPPAVRWYCARATKADLALVRYIDYDYWTELSGGSWLAVDAAEQIRQGIEAFRVGNGAYCYLAEVLEAGASFPELILVGADERGPHLLLEGHVRLTASFLVPDCIPLLLPVIVGYARGLDRK